MSYLLAGVVVLALLFWGGARKRLLAHPEWRVASAASALGLFAAAAFVGVRGGWGKVIELVLAGAVLAAAARWPRSASASAPPPSQTMSLGDARSILGVGPEATRQDVQAAYTRLMLRVHPDHGGAPGLAAQLNLARERLLKG